MTTPENGETPHFNVEVTDDVATISFVEPDIDVHSAPELRSSYGDLIEDESVRRLETDCSNLHYLDSSGLAVLVAGHERAKASEKEFVLRNPSQSLRKILEITGLVNLFEIEAES